MMIFTVKKVSYIFEKVLNVSERIPVNLLHLLLLSVHNELYKVVYIYLAKQNRKMFNIFEKLQ